MTMKATFLCAACASLALLVSATVWEGVSAAASRDLPGVFSIATNSFPRNAVVDITNLENGKMVRVVVVSGLETTGLLAQLSRNAAESIGLGAHSTCRIRMTLPPDTIAYSNFRLGPIVSTPSPAIDGAAEVASGAAAQSAYGEPEAAYAAASEYAAAAAPADSLAAAAPPAHPAASAANANGNAAAEWGAETAAAEPFAVEVISVESTAEAASRFAEVVAAEIPAEAYSYRADAAPAPSYYPPQAQTQAAHEPPVQTAPNPSGALRLVPAEERLPQPPSRVVISNNAPPAVQPVAQPVTQPAARVPAAASAPAPASEYVPPADFSPFQAPLISRLEQGKFYVQVAVYSRPDHVEDEISRIGAGYPLAIQNVGTETNPMFRVLLGPLSQGESSAMLQRFKSAGYKDAFVRNN